MEDYKGALEDIEMALEMDSLNAFAYSNRAQVAADQGRKADALGDWNRALELNNQVAEFYHRRGRFYLAEETYDKAVTDLSKSLEIAPYYETKAVKAALKTAKKKFLAGK